MWERMISPGGISHHHSLRALGLLCSHCSGVTAVCQTDKSWVLTPAGQLSSRPCLLTFHLSNTWQAHCKLFTAHRLHASSLPSHFVPPWNLTSLPAHLPLHIALWNATSFLASTPCFCPQLRAPADTTEYAAELEAASSYQKYHTYQSGARWPCACLFYFLTSYCQQDDSLAFSAAALNTG